MALPQFDLTGRRALVTGGASGIGAASARLLRQAGAEVVLWDLDAPAAERLAAELGGLGLGVDVTDPEAVERAAALTEAQGAAPTVLINCAGGVGPIRPLLDVSLEEWRQTQALNLESVFLVTRRCLPRMLAAGWGRVVNVASIAAKEGNANAAAYSAAKGGVIALTKALGKELAGSGVLVNCIAPAAVDTPFFNGIPADHRRAMLAKIPLGRFGEAEEIAQLVLWLSSEACSFSTGAVFDASGGRATY